MVFDIMMNIRQQPFGIDNGNMYPRQESFDRLLSGSDGPMACDVFVKIDI